MHRNSEKWTFSLCKILKSWPFLTALRRNFKKWIFLMRKNKKNLQPPLNFAEFGAPDADCKIETADFEIPYSKPLKYGYV